MVLCTREMTPPLALMSRNKHVTLPRWEKVFSIEFFAASGEEPVRAFLLALSAKARQKCITYIDLLALCASHVKKLEADIWELRPEFGGTEYRIFFGRQGETFVLLHAITKKRQKVSRSDITLWHSGVSTSGRNEMSTKTNDDFSREAQLADLEFRAGHEETLRNGRFGYALGGVREQRGLTQQALADMVGVKRTAIARLEGGDHAPTMTTLLKLVQALDAKLVIDSDGRIDLVAHRRRTKRGQSIAAR